MTNNLTGLVALISAITALITAIGTLILHIRSQNVQSKTPPQQPPPANAYDQHAENHPYNSAS